MPQVEPETFLKAGLHSLHHYPHLVTEDSSAAPHRFSSIREENGCVGDQTLQAHALKTSLEGVRGTWGSTCSCSPSRQDAAPQTTMGWCGRLLLNAPLIIFVQPAVLPAHRHPQTALAMGFPGKKGSTKHQRLPNSQEQSWVSWAVNTTRWTLPSWRSSFCPAHKYRRISITDISPAAS